MDANCESDDHDLSFVRSNVVIEHSWDDIVALHFKYEAPVAVHATPGAHISSSGKSQTVVRLSVITAETFSHICSELVVEFPEAVKTLAAPYRREVVKIVYVEEPSGRTRLLTLPAPLARA